MISDSVEIALIVAAPTFLTALGGLILQLLSFYEGRTRGHALAQKLEVVHQDVNGKMAQLLETTGAQREAVGEAAGRDKALAEQAARTAEVERKEDRVAGKLEVIDTKLTDHDEWERGGKLK